MKSIKLVILNNFFFFFSEKDLNLESFSLNYFLINKIFKINLTLKVSTESSSNNFLIYFL